MAVRAWLFDKLAAIFRRGKTEAKGVDVRDALAARSAASVSDLAGKLARGEMTLAQWSAEMAERVRAAHTAQYVLGAGGTAAMTDAMRAELGRLVGEQLGYLRGFARDIAAGKVVGPDAIAARANLYFDAAVGAYERGRAASLGYDLPEYPPAHPGCRCQWLYGGDGREQTAQWLTADDERVCPICTGLAAEYDRVVLGVAA